MELRRCSNMHFMLAIKGGLVIKASNVDSLGKPGLVFKKLEDIYEGAELEDLDASSKLKWKDRFRKLAFNFDGVKVESPCVPLVERKTRERGYGDYGKDSESDDLNFGNITLKQLRERCKTKKRKGSNVFGLSPKQECTQLEPEEDEFDLMESLSSLKSKISKSPKSKRKCRDRSVSPSSKIIVSIKAEPIMSDEDSLYCTSDFSAITGKAEDSVPEYSESHIMMCAMVDSSSCVEQVESGEVLKDFNCELQNVDSISFTEQYGSCTVNSLSYEHLEPVEDASLPSPVHVETMEVDKPEKTGQDSSVLHVPQLKEGYMKHPSAHESEELVSPVKDQLSDLCNISQSCSDSEVQVSSGSIDDGPCCRGELMEDLPPNVDCCSLSSNSPFSNCSSSLNPNPPLTTNNCLVSEGDSPLTEKKQPSNFTITDATRTCSNSDNKVVVAGDDSPINDDTQSQSSVAVNPEKSFSSKDYPSRDVLDDLSTSEVWHPPERLPSTRKAIAPTSEERLCLAMKSVERDNDIDHYECKGKVFFGKQNDKASPKDIGGTDLSTSPQKDKVSRKDIGGTELSMSPQKHAQVVRTKSTITPKEILRKPKNFKRGSPPKGGFEGPHLSRSFPRLSTGCTSIQGCSESAIAFSQRQMHDIESLATKLLKELKSVKEIVEEKLLYEAYRSTSLKNDADEVKNVIKNATKVEETSRKWLSMMARDCNRFCKIMRLTENEAAAAAVPENPIQRVKKKITFADEAGGTLCQVKLFENGMASSMEPKSETCELQAE